MTNNLQNAGALLDTLRSKTPLVHHITNYVTVNDCANITLAIGASPIMADSIDEVADMISICSALVINIGTLNTGTLASMVKAAKRANELNIPVILDPVGVGATPLRNMAIEDLLYHTKISVVRGNMSEIRFISGLKATSKGVDASESDSNIDESIAITTAKNLACKLNCIVAITGESDIISNGTRTVIIKNGHKLLSLVTGTGCMCTALVGCCCSATSDYFLATILGVMSMGIAGEIAYKKAGNLGTGSFHTAIIDAISCLDKETIISTGNIYEI